MAENRILMCNGSEFNVLYYDVVDSTNLEAKRQIKSDAKSEKERKRKKKRAKKSMRKTAYCKNISNKVKTSPFYHK